MTKQTLKCGNSLGFRNTVMLLLILTLLNCGVDIKSVGPSGAACTRIEGLPGPEDLALDAEEKILYVSSHERRTSNQTGKIFWIDLKNSSVPKELPVQFPPEFRPHGMSILKTKDVYRLYVISHPALYKTHTIEIFERKGKEWSHVGTLSDPSITSPNDLHAVSENEIYVSNDHGSGGFFRYLFWDDLFRFKRADIAYYDGKTWSNLNTPLFYGNGILYTKNSQGKEMLYRAGFADRSVYRYPIERTDGKPVLGPAEKIFLDSGTDNLELDSKGRIFVVGHGSTYQFVRHMLNADYHAPTQVFRISEDGSFQEVFATQGDLISAGSTAIPFEGRLYVAQVFNPFILNCEYNNN
ncbi:arylesterase [Leptospira tipperaryensis]|uniref:Arylesterase n=1 Tax=Leptospira tipperaryensis TaxID=2564040 RepID=A0A1D7UTC8_9LEPT|nr:arylesterase [Leptospira tipperaryensis]AOP32836.1 arylesterase [Leptospira tipperaryensis]